MVERRNAAIKMPIAEVGAAREAQRRSRPGRSDLRCPQCRMSGSLKERFSALRTLRPFIAMVWRASPSLMATSLSLRLVRALVPVVALYIGKLIIDDVVRLVQMPGRPSKPRRLAGERRAAVAGRVVAGRVCARRAVGRADPRRVAGRGLLAERVTNASSVSLMEHAATLDLEDFEDAEFQDQLERARRQTSGRLTLMAQLLAQAQVAGDGGELRRRPAGLCAVADRAAGGGAAAGVPGRAALQCPDLHARLRPHARSGASSTMCARRRPASRPPRK